MNVELPQRALAWLARVLPGTTLLRTSRLTGGNDHANDAVAMVDRTGREREYVLRRWVRPDWRTIDPDYTVEREQAALTLLERVAADTPRLVAVDPNGDEVGVPALLMSRLSGGPPPERISPSDVEDFVAELADAIGQIHTVDAADAGIPRYQPYHDLIGRHVPADAGDPSVWTLAMEFLAERTPPSGHTFIHRDYHPYNVLWQGHQVSAVIDWSNASVGHPDVDVAHMRWNLAVSYGYDVAERYRVAAQARSGREFDRYWDVRVVVDLIPEWSLGEELGPDLPGLGRTTRHGTPADRLATLERLLREGLAS